MLNKQRIIVYTVLTSIAFLGLAEIYVLAMQERYPNYSLLDGGAVVWSWMSLFMGLYMAIRLRRIVELFWGFLIFLLSLAPIIGVLFGLGYFAWCYTRLDRARMLTFRNDFGQPQEW